MILRLLSLVVGVFVAYTADIFYKKKVFSRKEFIFWIIVSLTFVIVSFYPKIFYFASEILGSEEPLAIAAILLGVFSFFLAFANYKQLQELRRKTEELVIKIALEKSK